MKQSINKVFVILNSIFLIYLYVSHLDQFDFLSKNNLVSIIMLIIVIIVAIWIAVRADQWLNVFNKAHWLKLIVSCFIIFVFIYQLFTPYFYSTDHLIKTGIINIETYFELANDELSADEQKELAESALSKMMAFTTISLDHVPKGKLVNIDLVNFSRSFYFYYLTVNLTFQHDEAFEQNVYEFTFTREGFAFKLAGYVMIE